MKLSKNLGRVATTLLATAMLASVSAVPAFAADQVQHTGDALEYVSITKELTKPENVYAPNVTFQFKINPVTDADENDIVENDSATGTRLENGVQVPVTGIEVYEGIQGGVYVADPEDDNNEDDDYNGQAVFAPNTSSTDGDIGKKMVTAEAKFAINNELFTHAGVYKYTISETAITAEGNYEGITNDTYTTRDLYVYVRESNTPGKFEVYGAVVKGGAENAGKTDRFTNVYGGTEQQPTVNDLVVAKDIEGDAANLGETFDFTISVTADNNAKGEAYYIVWGTLNESGVFEPTMTGEEGSQTFAKVETIYSVGTADQTTSTTVSLGDLDAVKIYGLSAGDTYTVTEKKANDNGYKTTVTTGYNLNDNGAVTGVLDDNKDEQIVFTNTRDAVSPTGIVMNVAPYALLVVVAAAGCFVFLRKRRED